MNRVWVGIDPGVKGALAAVDEYGLLVDIIPCPVLKLGSRTVSDEQEMGNIIRKMMNNPDYKIAKVGIEKVHAMPANNEDGKTVRGVTSTWTFAENFGIWKGALAALGVSWETYTPQRWRKLLIRDTPEHATTKQASALVARRLWPDGAFGKRLTQDYAEAALIAEATRRISTGLEHE